MFWRLRMQQMQDNRELALHKVKDHPSAMLRDRLQEPLYLGGNAVVSGSTPYDIAAYPEERLSLTDSDLPNIAV